jgi:class 3 adenylate cyclase/tetratricopeptide (TPR) repeat protein
MASFVFCDLVGSTALHARLGDDVADGLRRRIHTVLRDAVRSHGGIEVKNLGDGLMASFQSAADAVSSGVAMQQAVARLAAGHPGIELGLRVGVSAGEATVEHDDWFGTPVVEAARLCDRATAGQVLVSDVAHLLVSARRRHTFRPLGPLELKGLPAPVAAHEVEWEPLADLPPEPVAPTGGAGSDAAHERSLPNRLRRFPPFGYFGREVEQTTLAEAWKEALTGRGQLVLVSGEPGIGKTAIAAELAKRVHAEGAVVLYGHCDDDLGVPYQPFVEALRDFPVEEWAVPAALSAWARAHGGALLPLLPELVARFGEVPNFPTGDPETERYRLFKSVSALLGELAGSQPVLFVLDDLHWAAKPTLMLLKYATAALESMPVLFLGTFRESDVSRSHPLAELLADLRRDQAVTRVGLRGLADDEVVALMESAGGQALHGQGVALAHAVHRETDGNPFFVTEILRHLAESGAIVREGPHWVPAPSLGDVGLPVSVREVVGQRLGRLREETVRLLGLAAVIGRDFDLNLLSRASDLPEDRLLDALDEAAAAALIHEAPGRPDRFTFSHALVQHVLYDDLSGLRRVRTHQRVAAALEELCGDDPGERVTELAHHWVVATRPIETDRAVDYARRAGDRALAQLAPEEATGWYAQALELHEGHGREDAGLHADLLIGLGEAQRRAGQPAFRETLLRAAAIARAGGDTDRLVRAALANNRGIHSASGYADPDRVAVLEAAADALGHDDSAARARVLATLAVELTYSERDRERRRVLADEALAVARRLGDDAALARVLNLRFNVVQVPENAAEQLASTAEGLEVTSRLGDPVERFWALQWRLWALGTGGLIEELQEHLAEIDATADALGQPVLRWFTHFHRSWAELLVGRIAESERLALEALQIGNDTGQPDALPIFVAQLAMIRRDQGRLDELVDTLARAVADNPGIPGFGLLLALCCCELERYDEARAAFAPAAADGFASIPHDPVWSSSMTMGAEVASILGDTDAAVVLTENLRSFAGMLAHNGCTTFGAIDRYLGLLAVTLGRYFEADAHFAAAAAIHSRIGAPAWLARTQVDWARMLQRRAGRGDAEQAGELLASTLRTARKIGLPTIERQATALLHQAG